MLVVDTGEITKEVLEKHVPPIVRFSDHYIRFEPSIWVITDWGKNWDFNKRYTFELINLNPKTACLSAATLDCTAVWRYADIALSFAVTKARNMGLEGVRGVV